MPNWCANRVTVYGEPSELERFKDFVKGEEEPFSFESIMPIPEKLLAVQSPVVIVDTEAEVDLWIENHKNNSFFESGHPITKRTQDIFLMDFGFDNWYDWSCENWGVKWDARDVTVEDYWEAGEVQYKFDTPWGPPEGIYSTLITKFPDVSIEWFWDEPGMRNAGYL